MAFCLRRIYIYLAVPSIAAAQTQTIQVFASEVTEIFTVCWNMCVRLRNSVWSKSIGFSPEDEAISFKRFTFATLAVDRFSVHKSRSHELFHACDVHCSLSLSF